MNSNFGVRSNISGPKSGIIKGDEFGSTQQGFGKTALNQTSGTMGGSNPASLKGKLMTLEVNLHYYTDG